MKSVATIGELKALIASLDDSAPVEHAFGRDPHQHPFEHALVLFQVLRDAKANELVEHPSADRVANFYPLQQITIKLQGTRHSTRDRICAQLVEIYTRLKRGDSHGASYEADFGYQFDVVENSEGPSFFSEVSLRS